MKTNTKVKTKDGETGKVICFLGPDDTLVQFDKDNKTRNVLNIDLEVIGEKE